MTNNKFSKYLMCAFGEILLVVIGILIAFFNQRLFTLENVDFKVPNNFDAIKLDTEFINNLTYITAERKNFNLYPKDMLDKTKSVADKIVNELKRLEN